MGACLSTPKATSDAARPAPSKSDQKSAADATVAAPQSSAAASGPTSMEKPVTPPPEVAAAPQQQMGGYMEERVPLPDLMPAGGGAPMGVEQGLRPLDGSTTAGMPMGMGIPGMMATTGRGGMGIKSEGDLMHFGEGSRHGGLPMFQQQNMMAARMAGSMHGGMLPSNQMNVGHMAGMGGSMHGGLMMGGSTYAGQGSRLAVQNRSVQASALRESKPAMERHNVNIHGNGPELLVFSHAFGSNQSVWNPIIEMFDPERYRVVTFDLIGSAGSNYDMFDYQRYNTLNGFCQDLLELLQELGLEGGDWSQQCTFIGHQQSGMIGLLASVERPGLFSRIITIGASPRLLGAKDYEGSFALSDLDQVFGLMLNNYKMWNSGLIPHLTADDVRSDKVREFVRPIFALRSDVAFAQLKTVFACDVRDVLPKVKVQVHMLFIARDPTVPQSVVQYMLNTIPNAYAEILAVENFSTRPEVIAAGILRHLSMPLRDTNSLSARHTFSIRFAPNASGRANGPPSVPSVAENGEGGKAEGVEIDII